MKKLTILGFIAVVLLIGVSACKSKESAYKAAYMKAQEKEAVEEVPVENEVVTTQAPVHDDATKLKLYNVVVGSFSVKTNASSLKERLIQDGYGAFTARNNQMMFRVIAGSFDTRKEAEELRDAIKLKYSPEFSDAWLLINR